MREFWWTIALTQTRSKPEVFSAISDVASASERSGRRSELGAGLWTAPVPSLRLRLGLSTARQEAARLSNAYDQFSAHLAPEWSAGRGAFVQALVAYAVDRYHAPDPLVSPRNRNDDVFLARATVGASLGAFWRALGNLYLSQSFEYQHAVSNLQNFQYENKKLSTQVSYAWGWAR